MKNISTGTGLCVLGLCLASYPIIDREMPRAEAGATYVANRLDRGRATRTNAVVLTRTSDAQIADRRSNLSEPLDAPLVSAQRLGSNLDSSSSSYPATSREGSDFNSSFAKLAGADCSAKNWFSPQLHFFGTGCGPIVPLPITPADVDGDGVEEMFYGNRFYPEVLEYPQQTAYGTPITLQNPVVCTTSWISIESGLPTPQTAAACTLTNETMSTLYAMLPSANDGPLCSEANLGTHQEWSIGAFMEGWLDCDGDGDLDIVLSFASRRDYANSGNGYFNCYPYIDEYGFPQEHCDYGWICSGRGSEIGFRVTGWLENTGFEKPTSPIVADLNRDGKVDGADLGMLLVAWGPNP
jgi:hypothetical protein